MSRSRPVPVKNKILCPGPVPVPVFLKNLVPVSSRPGQKKSVPVPVDTLVRGKDGVKGKTILSSPPSYHSPLFNTIPPSFFVIFLLENS